MCRFPNGAFSSDCRASIFWTSSSAARPASVDPSRARHGPRRREPQSNRWLQEANQLAIWSSGPAAGALAGRLRATAKLFPVGPNLVDRRRRRPPRDRHVAADVLPVLNGCPSNCQRMPRSPTKAFARPANRPAPGAESSNRPLPAELARHVGGKDDFDPLRQFTVAQRDAPMILADRPSRGRNAVGAHVDQSARSAPVRASNSRRRPAPDRMWRCRSNVRRRNMPRRCRPVGLAAGRSFSRPISRSPRNVRRPLRTCDRDPIAKIRARIAWAAARNSIRSLPNSDFGRRIGSAAERIAMQLRNAQRPHVRHAHALARRA